MGQWHSLPLKINNSHFKCSIVHHMIRSFKIRFTKPNSCDCPFSIVWPICNLLTANYKCYTCVWDALCNYVVFVGRQRKYQVSKLHMNLHIRPMSIVPIVTIRKYNLSVRKCVFFPIFLPSLGKKKLEKFFAFILIANASIIENKIQCVLHLHSRLDFTCNVVCTCTMHNAHGMNYFPKIVAAQGGLSLKSFSCPFSCNNKSINWNKHHQRPHL